MSRPYTDTLALPDAAMSSQRAPLAGVVSAGTPPPPMLKESLWKGESSRVHCRGAICSPANRKTNRPTVLSHYDTH
jgi:hypothetical protein